MGLGDDIMATGYARLAKEKYPDFQIVIGNQKKEIIFDSVIFKNNPNITSAKNIDYSINKVWIEHHPGKRPYIEATNEKKIYWNRFHKAVKGDLYFDDEEIIKAKLTLQGILERNKNENLKKRKKIIFIEPSRKFKSYKNDNVSKTQLGELNRCWKKENWIKLIDIFKDKVIFIQSFYEGSVSYDNVYEYKSDFRNACAMMSLCDVYLGWEGGLAHAAAALQKKSVVLFGGWIDPSITGYQDHINIYIDIEGSPCGMRNACEHCKKCIELITVDKVSDSLNYII